MPVDELLQNIATSVTSVAVVAGGAWWLLGPRVTGWVREVTARTSEAAQAAHEQLQPDRPGSTAAHAATAARAAQELPQLRDAVQQLLAAQADVDELRLPERLQLVELQLDNTDRRLGSVEQALIAQLGNDLARERGRTT